MRSWSRFSTLLIISFVLVACADPFGQVAPASNASPLAGAMGVQLFVYPDDSEQMLFDMISSANQRVYMTMYLLTDLRVIEAMAQAKSNGADVRAMIEQHPYGSDGSAAQAYNAFKERGISVKYADPAYRYTHEKSFVIDQAVIILTANLTRGAFGYNRELGVVQKDAGDVQEVVDAFNADWNRTKFLPGSSSLVWSPGNSRERFSSVIKSATHSLDLYAEEAQDDELTQLLIDAAGRGISVRVITSPPIDSTGPDRNEADLDKMQRGRVYVRYLASPYIHAKLIVADAMLGYIGSGNISTTSLEYNRELGIILSDPTALGRVSSTFEHDWQAAVDR
jgi:cardiolipin synthase A/B